MNSIIIGESQGKSVRLDLDVLLRTRLLVTADSGGGKTVLLKRLCEQIFGKIPIIIIDPEGEFSPLREKFGFVLVGQGGETPADPRSAALVAQTLLKLRASAVCDIYEMKPAARHEFVRNFCDALIDAPKSLWHPTIVIVDEAHMFCPEAKAGESLATDSVKALSTRGRKRGICPIYATQRLAEFNKGASSMCLNRMVGGTFEDVNQDRAVNVLSVTKEERHGFLHQLKLLEPGYFFALGRAICTERTLVHVGSIETAHGEQALKYANEPPPAPEKVRALLPKLADLPKMAEEKARTESELRKEIANLKIQLRQRPAESKEIKVADQSAIDRAVREHDVKWRAHYQKCISRFNRAADVFENIQRISATEANVLRGPLPPPELKSSPEKTVHVKPMPRPPLVLTEPVSDSTVRGTPRKMLQAIAEFEAIGVSEPTRGMVAGWCGIKPNTGTFSTYVSSLVSPGYVSVKGEKFSLADAGRALTSPVEAVIDTQELLRRCTSLFGKTPANMLRLIHETYPSAISKEEIGERLGISHTSGTFSTYLSELRSAGMVENVDGDLKAAEWLFLGISK